MIIASHTDDLESVVKNIAAMPATRDAIIDNQSHDHVTRRSIAIVNVLSRPRLPLAVAVHAFPMLAAITSFVTGFPRLSLFGSMSCSTGRHTECRLQGAD